MNKIYGLNLDKISSEEIIQKIGINRFQNDQLLDAFLEVMDNIEALWGVENYKRDQCYLESAPFAYEIYKRFYGCRPEPPKMSHPSLKTEHLPNTIQFWADSVAIHLLFKMIVNDGFYERKSPKEPLSKEDHDRK